MIMPVAMQPMYSWYFAHILARFNIPSIHSTDCHMVWECYRIDDVRHYVKQPDMIVTNTSTLQAKNGYLMSPDYEMRFCWRIMRITEGNVVCESRAHNCNPELLQDQEVEAPEVGLSNSLTVMTCVSTRWSQSSCPSASCVL